MVIRVQSSSGGTESDGDPKDIKSVCLEAGAMPKGWETPSSHSMNIEDNNDQKLENNIKSNHTFSPKDLLALVKNLELEINMSEGKQIYLVTIIDMSVLLTLLKYLDH